MSGVSLLARGKRMLTVYLLLVPQRKFSESNSNFATHTVGMCDPGETGVKVQNKTTNWLLTCCVAVELGGRQNKSGVGMYVHVANSIESQAGIKTIELWRRSNRRNFYLLLSSPTLPAWVPAAAWCLRTKLAVANYMLALAVRVRMDLVFLIFSCYIFVDSPCGSFRLLF